MAENLIIVESPAKSKTITKFLGKGYKVVASMGHIRDLPKSQIGVDVDNNFEPKYITIRGKGDLISSLKKEAKNAKNIFLATDPDREGEAISWHLAYLLGIDANKNCRITFNEITKSAVKDAIKSPRPIDMNLVDSQQARRVLDRIVGYKLSPILWKKVKKGLSAGRVQSVALRLIVDREEEINAFIPEEYWNLIANLAEPILKKSFEARLEKYKNKKLTVSSKEEMDKILNDLKNAKYIVSEVKKGQKKRNPAPPFITSTLQQEAARKLGFTLQKTMSVAQQLYEGIDIGKSGSVGLITYMRTDSIRISNEAIAEAKEYIVHNYGEEYHNTEPRFYKSRGNAQDAHEAIRPTHVDNNPDSIKSSLSNDQFKLYRLIWERFIASQMSNAILDTLSVSIDANEYLFKATGSQIKFIGFMTVYVESKDIEDEINTILPDMKENQELKLKKLDPEQHFTQPPARYTEASLVRALEEKGIGRPSTYAPTISTIIARYYIERDKKQLVPTELGTVVTHLLKEHFKDIINEEFTANMEQKLDDVEEGQIDWVSIIREFYYPFIEVVQSAETKIGDVELKDEVTDIKCELCGRNMVIKLGRFGKFLACPGFPECRNTKPIVEETKYSCPNCGGKIVIKKTKKKMKYYACENSSQCGFMTWDTPTDQKCPVCGKMILKKKGSNKDVCVDENCAFNEKPAKTTAKKAEKATAKKTVKKTTKKTKTTK